MLYYKYKQIERNEVLKAMSYYGVKNLKIVKTSEGKYNVACMYYDSSIRDYKGNRVWEYTNHFYNKDYATKEEVEYALFQDTLDGNIHGTGGKFSCIGWSNCKVSLSDEELTTLRELKTLYEDAEREEMKYRKLHNLSWNDDSDMKANMLSKVAHNLNMEIINTRYSFYYTKWKSYLNEKKNTKKDKAYYIILIKSHNYSNSYYIKSLGNSYLNFTCYEDSAKVYHTTLKELSEKLLWVMKDERYTEISAIEVSKYLKSYSRQKKYALIPKEMRGKLPLIPIKRVEEEKEVEEVKS